MQRISSVVSMEQAHQIISEMVGNTKRTDIDGASVVEGRHEDLGALYVVLPAFGNAIILPFASQ